MEREKAGKGKDGDRGGLAKRWVLTEKANGDGVPLGRQRERQQRK